MLAVGQMHVGLVVVDGHRTLACLSIGWRAVDCNAITAYNCAICSVKAVLLLANLGGAFSYRHSDPNDLLVGKKYPQLEHHMYSIARWCFKCSHVLGNIFVVYVVSCVYL